MTFKARLIPASLLLFFSVLSGSFSEAKVIQILHTNDLHAALNIAGAPADGQPAFGGWAQVKTVMDQLTASAKTQDIETIRLDAGDFFEGTLSYFPDHGVNVLRAFQNMGYDAGSLGNHDWLMGAQNLDDVFGQSPFPFPLLSANTQVSSWLKNLNRQIVPTASLERAGIKIGIVGLSTDEIFYKWITKVDSYKNDMKILDYRDYIDPKADPMSPDYTVSGIANETAAELGENHDLVIALTHIGFKEDKKLAASSSNIDLIVGGHSHTRLDSLGLIENKEGYMVPIVQTGATGVYIGKILVDVNPGKKPEVLTYELVPVSHDVAADPTIAALLEQSERRIEAQYGANTLNEVVGHADTALVSGTNGPTAYSRFVVDAMRDTAETDLAIDFGEFHSNSSQAKGDVTMRKLMEMYPRKLNVEQNEGLYVYRFKTPGWILKIALNVAVKLGYELSTSGIEFKTYEVSEEEFQADKAKMGDNWKAKALTHDRLVTSSILINGKPLKLFKRYRVAAPEFLVRGAYAISFLTRLVLQGGRPSPYTIWDASKLYLGKIKTIRDGQDFQKELSSAGEYPHTEQLIETIMEEVQAAPEFKSLQMEEVDQSAE